MLPLLAMSDPPGGESGVMFALKHALDHSHGELGGGITLSSFKVMIALAAVVVLLITLLVDKRSLVPKGFFRSAIESLVLMIRGMVRNAMGAHGHEGHHTKVADRYVPFFCTAFLFILVMNLLGMVPIPKFGGTATSNLMVTGALALIVLVTSVASGFIYHGAGGFLKLFTPSGLPPLLVPLLFVLEFVGFFIKHGVLMVRLFANMLAGHLVIGAFLGLIADFESYLVAGFLSVPLALFVSFLEILVAFLQAYVFTLLSVLFVGGMVHPEH
jgi:F-type H+-transporting ATPase subunit a